VLEPPVVVTIASGRETSHGFNLTMPSGLTTLTFLIFLSWWQQPS
jgi:hypothetical protein